MKGCNIIEYRKERIVGFEEYQIDTNGVIYNKNGSVKRYSLNRQGYCIVNFYVDGVRTGRSVHNLTARQFIPNPENKPTVNHIDGNKEKNIVENLEWATSKEQMEHRRDVFHQELSKHCRKPIIGLHKSTNTIIYQFDSLANAARYFANGKEYRYYQNSIYRALKGLRKTYKKCKWVYCNSFDLELDIAN